MDRITHAVKGLDAMRARLSTLPKIAAGQAAATLGDVAQAAAEDARRALRQGQAASGQGSLPGQPPADPQARIAAAVRAAPNRGGTGSTVTVDLPFARDLEFGTTRMAPRPFLRPVMLQARPKAVAALAAALRGILSGTGSSQ